MNSLDTWVGTCMVCRETREVRGVDLYINGSEGLRVCHPCEMEVLELIRNKMRERGIERKEEFKKRKRESEKKSVEAFTFLDYLFGKYIGGK